MSNESKLVGSDIIRFNTEAYGKEILLSHFPSPIDGLKVVRRRILYSLRDKTGQFKGSELISRATKIHEHGDASIYDAAINIGQSYRYPFPLIHIVGDNGTYGGDKAASSRYNDFEISEFCRDIFIRGIDLTTLPMTIGENMTDYEPEFFIPKIPTALLFNNNSVGFGFKSLTLPLKFENICDLVISLSKAPNKQTWVPNKPELLLPFFPIKNRTLNKSELIAGYKRRDFKVPVIVEGAYEVKDHQTIIINTFAFGVSAKSVWESLIDYIRDKNHWLSKLDADDPKDLSDHHNYAKFYIRIRKNVNILEVVEKLKKTLSITSVIHPHNNYVRDAVLVQSDPITVLKYWYQERYRSVLGYKKHRQQALQYKMMVSETYITINDHVDEVVEIIKKNGKSGAYRLLHARFDLSMRQCEILINSKLINLSSSKTKELQAELGEQKKEYNELLKSFGNIDKEIMETTKALKKKYSTDLEHRAGIDTFKGMVFIEGIGVIQFKDDDDMLKICSKWKRFYKHVYRFTKAHIGVHVELVRGKSSVIRFGDLPRTFLASKVTLVGLKGMWTFAGIGNKTIIAGGPVTSDINMSCNQVGSDTWVISDKKIRHVAMTDMKTLPVSLNGSKDVEKCERYKHIKDSITCRKTTSDTYYAFEKIPRVNEYLVFSINTGNTSSIRVQKINLKDAKDKFLLSYENTTYVLGVFPLDAKDVVIHVPKGVANFSNILIPDMQKFVKKQRVMDIGIKSFQKIY